MGRIARRIVAMCFLCGFNVFLVAAAPGKTHPDGQCELFLDHCACVLEVTVANCHLDSDCDWGVCGR